jgi:hypothetical protein
MHRIITPLFDTQAPTYFDIHVPSSGSFLYPRELLESRNVLCCLSYTVNVGGLCAHNQTMHGTNIKQQADCLHIERAKSKRRSHKLKRVSFICLTCRSKEKNKKS